MRKRKLLRIPSTLIAFGYAIIFHAWSPEVSAQSYSKPFLAAVGSSPSAVFRMKTSRTTVSKLYEFENVTALVSDPAALYSQFIANGSIYSTLQSGPPELLTADSFASVGLGINVSNLDLFYLGGSETGLYKMAPYGFGQASKESALVTPLTPFHTPGYIAVDNVTPAVYWLEYGVIDGTSNIRKINYLEANAAPTTFYSQVDTDEGGHWIGPMAARRNDGLYYCLPGDETSTIKYLPASGSSTPSTTATLTGRCTSMAYQDVLYQLLIGIQLPNGTGKIIILNALSSVVVDEIAVNFPVMALGTGTLVLFSTALPATTPVVQIQSGNVSFTFGSYARNTSASSLQASAATAKYSYELVLKGPGKKKNKVVVTTKATYTYKKLKAGAYTFKYRVLQKNGKKISKSKFSAPVTFTIS